MEGRLEHKDVENSKRWCVSFYPESGGLSIMKLQPTNL